MKLAYIYKKLNYSSRNKSSFDINHNHIIDAFYLHNSNDLKLNLKLIQTKFLFNSNNLKYYRHHFAIRA